MNTVGRMLFGCLVFFRQYTSILLLVFGCAPALLVFMGERQSLTLDGELIGESDAYSASFTWASRVLNGIISVLFMRMIYVGWMRNNRAIVENQILALSIIGFVALNYLMGAIFGLYAGLPDNIYLYASYVLLAIYCVWGDGTPDALVEVARGVIFSMLCGVLLMAVLFPNLAYSGDSFDFRGDGSARRLMGLFNHPRQIGIYCLVLMVIEVCRPSAVISRWSAFIVVAVCLYLSTSKTAIILGVVFVFYEIIRKNLIVGFLSIALTVILFYVSFYELTSRFVEYNIDNILSFTGRTYLWDGIVESFATNPFGGNGPRYFSGDNVTGFAHAHNIVLQGASDGGVFGILGLILLTAVVGWNAYLHSGRTNRLSWYLPAALFLFSMFEPVIRIESFLDGSYFILFFVVCYISCLNREYY